MSERYVCPCCLYTGMRGALDKKGRPYLRCWDCGTMLFPRRGNEGFATTVGVLRCIDDDVAGWARKQARELLDRPGGLPALLAPATASASDAPALPGPKERIA